MENEKHVPAKGSAQDSCIIAKRVAALSSEKRKAFRDFLDLLESRDSQVRAPCSRGKDY